MFAEERPYLGALPLEPFRYYRYGTRSVHLDGCVEVEASYYSVPPGRIGQRVAVQWNDLHVRILDPRSGQLLREHLRTRRGHQDRSGQVLERLGTTSRDRKPRRTEELQALHGHTG